MENPSLPHDHGEHINDILKQMPESEDFFLAAEIFQQLCDGSRLRILWLLCHCEECGINIAAIVGMSPAAVSHHLKTLRLHGLITSRRSGKEIYYTLAGTKTALLVHQMIDDYFHLNCPGKGLTNHGSHN